MEKMWGFWSGAHGVREAECEMLSEMLHPGQKKRQHFSSLTSLTNFYDVRGLFLTCCTDLIKKSVAVLLPRLFSPL